MSNSIHVIHTKVENIESLASTLDPRWTRKRSIVPAESAAQARREVIDMFPGSIRMASRSCAC
jgi:hypothetical protein